jgi:hypothetical protein
MKGTNEAKYGDRMKERMQEKTNEMTNEKVIFREILVLTVRLQQDQTSPSLPSNNASSPLV